MSAPDITPETKVGALLDAYPALEEALMGLSPEFARLKSPLLRRTVAKVATLRQVAKVGGIPLGVLVNTLRKVAGFPELPAGPEGGPEAAPPWATEPPAEVFDVRGLLEAGGHPLPQVLARLEALGPGKTLALVTPFHPAPLIEEARGKGYAAFTSREGEHVFRTLLRQG